MIAKRDGCESPCNVYCPHTPEGNGDETYHLRLYDACRSHTPYSEGHNIEAYRRLRPYGTCRPRTPSIEGDGIETYHLGPYDVCRPYTTSGARLLPVIASTHQPRSVCFDFLVSTEFSSIVT